MSYRYEWSEFNRFYHHSKRPRIYSKKESIDFYKDIIQEIANTKIPVKIFILDCCRSEISFNSNRGLSSDNSFSNSLASVDAPFGSLISYSTSPGQTASDGDGKNSPFVKALIKNISMPGLSIEEVFKKTRIDLYSLTNKKQVSWEHSSLIGDVCLFTLTEIEEFSIEYTKNTYIDCFSTIDSPIISRFIDILKTYNWYDQNSILKDFNLFLFKNSEGVDMNDLFLLGRNFLQAAYGDATYIKEYLNNIKTIIETWSNYNIFHFTNGILYEIFFNSNGKCRKNPKYDTSLGSFLECLKLNEFSNSIEFIKRMLRETNKAFYEDLSTGKKCVVTVNAIQQKDNSGNKLNKWDIVGLTVKGNNILYMEDGKHKVENIDYNHDNSILITLDSLIILTAEMLVMPKSVCLLRLPVGINNKSIITLPDGIQLLLNPIM